MSNVMKARRWAARGLLVLACTLAAPVAARADALEDFFWLMDQADAAGVNPFPVSGSEIKASKTLFECLDEASSDTAVAGCIQSAKNTPLGERISGGIPSWFWDFLDLYVAFREGDFWGVVEHLGEAAICLAAQVMTGGSIDVCGVIKELIELGKTLLDAGEAIVAFVEDVGGEAWGAIKSVGCSLGFGGCGDSDPPVVMLYALVFAPHVGEGRKARETLMGKEFDDLLAKLQDVASKPVPMPFGSQSFSAADQKAASGAFVNAVDAQWTADIVKSVLKALASKRAEYDSPAQVQAVAGAAALTYWQKGGLVKSLVIQRCAVDDFGAAFGYAHVDRWISRFPATAHDVSAISNTTWCETGFFKKNRDEFAAQFGLSVSSHGCPAQATAYTCANKAALEGCYALLSSVDHEEQCHASGGLELAIATEIAAYFKSHGSTHPCTTQSTAHPVVFDCTRPVQGLTCVSYYSTHYGKFFPPLLKCTVHKPGDYQALETKVAAAAVELGNEMNHSFVVDKKNDPLVVFAAWKAPPLSDAYKKDFGFGPPSLQPGFSDGLHPAQGVAVDGVDTPVLRASLLGFKPPMYGVKPEKEIPDPAKRAISRIRPSGNPIVDDRSAVRMDARRMQEETIVPNRAATAASASGQARSVGAVAAAVLSAGRAQIVVAADLLAANKAHVSAGRLDARRLAGRGSSGGGQALHWADGKPGDALEITIDVPARATYAIEMSIVRAPNFGRFQVQIDGKAVAGPLDAFASSITPSGPIRLGQLAMNAGQHTVRFQVLGKSPGSKSYGLGIDRLTFSPASQSTRGPIRSR